jgi:hypothetical protein
VILGPGSNDILTFFLYLFICLPWVSQNDPYLEAQASFTEDSDFQKKRTDFAQCWVLSFLNDPVWVRCPFLNKPLEKGRCCSMESSGQAVPFPWRGENSSKENQNPVLGGVVGMEATDLKHSPLQLSLLRVVGAAEGSPACVETAEVKVFKNSYGGSTLTVTCCGWCLLCQAVHSTWCPSR